MVRAASALPFYLTRQLPFTDLTVKAAHDPSKLWSMTGRPIADRATAR